MDANNNRELMVQRQPKKKVKKKERGHSYLSDDGLIQNMHRLSIIIIVSIIHYYYSSVLSLPFHPAQICLLPHLCLFFCFSFLSLPSHPLRRCPLLGDPQCLSLRGPLCSSLQQTSLASVVCAARAPTHSPTCNGLYQCVTGVAAGPLCIAH